jgi:hypothetical protein
MAEIKIEYKGEEIDYFDAGFGLIALNITFASFDTSFNVVRVTYRGDE